MYLCEPHLSEEAGLHELRYAHELLVAGGEPNQQQ